MRVDFLYVKNSCAVISFVCRRPSGAGLTFSPCLPSSGPCLPAGCFYLVCNLSAACCSGFGLLSLAAAAARRRARALQKSPIRPAAAPCGIRCRFALRRGRASFLCWPRFSCLFPGGLIYAASRVLSSRIHGRLPLSLSPSFLSRSSLSYPLALPLAPLFLSAVPVLRSSCPLAFLPTSLHVQPSRPFGPFVFNRPFGPSRTLCIFGPAVPSVPDLSVPCLPRVCIAPLRPIVWRPCFGVCGSGGGRVSARARREPSCRCPKVGSGGRWRCCLWRT